MNLNKKNRTELRSYFVKNSIPTESNFADLIDGMLNQKEDGIFKLTSQDPLSIVATGDPTGQQKLINFYQNLGDADPAWMLNLSPQGFSISSISDGQGMSRLFIDRNTGNIGIGTTTPHTKLEVTGGGAIVNGVTIGTDGDGIDYLYEYETIGVLKANNNLRLQSPNCIYFHTGNPPTEKAKLSIYTDGTLDVNGSLKVTGGYIRFGASLITLGLEGNGGGQLVLANNKDDNKIFLEAFNAAGNGNADELLLTGCWSRNVPKLSLWADTTCIRGNVGIGTTSPVGGLHIANSGQGWSTHNVGTNVIVKGGQRNPAIGICDYKDENPWAIVNGDGKLLFAQMPPIGNIASEPTYRVTIDKQGNVGIGTTSPEAKLHISDPSYGNIKLFSNLNQLITDFGYDGGGDSIFWFTNYGNESGSTWFKWNDRNLLIMTNTGNVILGAKSTYWGHDPYNDVIGPPVASIGRLEVGGYHDGSEKVPAILRIHQWGSGSAEFYKPQGQTLYLRGTPGGGGGWFNTLEVQGAICAGNSDLYFSRTDHNHSGIGNTAGWAAIENAKDADALMILGRAGTDKGRKVKLWDYLEVNGVFVNNSDRQLKTDIENLKYGLEELRRLRPVSFNWRTIPNPHRSLGLIAQEVQPVIQEAVYSDDVDTGDSHLSIAYTIAVIPGVKTWKLM
ncbi:MAG: tail fiber domain-containing protein [Candidatus Competibacteraceae bacterium]